MHTNCFFVVLLLSTFISLRDAARESIDGGFGTHIKWYTSVEEAINTAQLEFKPIMLIVHRSWCPACKRLRPELRKSQKFAELSESFVMVNLDDESDGQAAAKYAPDGGYVPRIMFLDWNGELRSEFFNKWGSGKYKYYYSTADTVTKTMKSFLDYCTPIANFYKQQYAQPETQYTQPETQYAQPETQYAQPETRYAQSEIQYAQPEIRYAQPEYQYNQPENRYAQPAYQYNQPENQYAQLAYQYAQPENQYAQLPYQYAQPWNQFAAEF